MAQRTKLLPGEIRIPIHQPEAHASLRAALQVHYPRLDRNNLGSITMQPRQLFTVSRCIARPEASKMAG